jgi:mannose-6-phosphate isomerase-like protein (cupin superfamily)
MDGAGFAVASDHHRTRGFRQLQLQCGELQPGLHDGLAHTHSCDQILVVTSGAGMVATEHEQREINVGDVVHIKAGERHWHGAKADTTMGHITITLVGGQATWG